MTRERLEELKREYGYNAEDGGLVPRSDTMMHPVSEGVPRRIHLCECLDALDELIPPREFKPGDVVARWDP